MAEEASHLQQDADMIPVEEKEALQISDHKALDPAIQQAEEDTASQYVPTFKRATPAMLGQIPHRYHDIYLNAEDQIMNIDYGLFSSRKRLAKCSTNLAAMKAGAQKSRDMYDRAKSLHGKDGELSAESAITAWDRVEKDLVLLEARIEVTEKEFEELAVLIKAGEAENATAQKELEKLCAEMAREGNVKSCRAWSVFRLL